MAEKGSKKHEKKLKNIPWEHKWGFKDTEFIRHPDGAVELKGSRYLLSGYKMYDFMPYVEQVLGVKIDPHDFNPELEKKHIEPAILNQAFSAAIASTFPADRYATDDEQRLIHSHGQTTSEEVYKVLYSRLARYADMVFFPHSEDEVKKLVELAKTHDVCLIPYGGGTSVSCALKLPASEPRMIVSVDMKRMNRVLWIDRENLRACAEAGIIGMDLEELLNREGFICGHEPDSIELSTLGGWIATNASGMKKNRYGNIEHVIENITMVTPEGVIEQKDAFPRASIGLQPQNLLFGNEGNLGIITKAVFRIHRKPEVTKYGSLVFRNMDDGIEFLHKLAYTDYIPASIRLVDNIQFKFGMALKAHAQGMSAWVDKLKKLYLLKLMGFDPDQMVAATVVMEGSGDQVRYQERNLYRLAKEFGGIPAGAANGRRGYMLTYAIAYIRDFVATFHAIGETFETTVPWNKIQQVYNAVVAKAGERHKEVGLPGSFYVSYRITQIYHTGVCIYFMLGLYTKGIEHPEVVFADIEHSLRQAIIDHGGSISHHHGVGKLRKDFMKDTLSPDSIEFLKRVKKCVDPQNIFGARNAVFADEE